MADPATVARRLRERGAEIEQAIFGRVRTLAPDSSDSRDADYLSGLRSAVAAAIEFGLRGLERGEGGPAAIPAETLAQARRAARSGVTLDAVLRRYLAGHTLLWDYVMEEADRAALAGPASGLREMLRIQAALLDRIVAAVTREHLAELRRAGRSSEQRLLERVRMLLAGECAESAVLGYRLEAAHLAVIVKGAGCHEALRELAQRLDRELLSVRRDEETVWGWLGGREPPRMVDVEAAVLVVARGDGAAGASGGRACAAPGSAERCSTPLVLRFAVGEPGRGLEGWRFTHRQAQAALLVALRQAQTLTRYADVALLASALNDDLLSSSLSAMYLAPLQDVRHGPALRETLGAYLAAERNASAAAAALGVARNTVDNRLRAIEEQLGRPLQRAPAELEVALRLHDLESSDTAFSIQRR
ncbi:MAG: helix-turn-helix domain-containing protein [Solirubrobacteraceae bacterium]